MRQYVANLHLDVSVIQIMLCDKLHHSVIQHFCRATKMFCRTTHVFCNQLVRSVLCDFELSIFQYGPGNQLINRWYLYQIGVG